MLETFSHYARDLKNPFSFSHLSLFTLVGVVKNHFHLRAFHTYGGGEKPFFSPGAFHTRGGKNRFFIWSFYYYWGGG